MFGIWLLSLWLGSLANAPLCPGTEVGPDIVADAGGEEEEASSRLCIEPEVDVPLLGASSAYVLIGNKRLLLR